MDMLKALTAPSEYFRILRSETGVKWANFGILMIVGLLFWIYFMGAVDLDWLAKLEQDAYVRRNGTASAVELKIATQMITPRTISVGVIFGHVFMMASLTFVMALALRFIMPLVVKRSFSFRSLLNLVVATQLPGLLNFAVMLLVFLQAGSKQVGIPELDITSLNQLVMHFDVGHPYYGLASSVNLFTLWSFVLLTLGIKEYLESQSWADAAAVALAPYALIFGTWFVFAAI